jgi:hypothetical protein
LKSHEFDRIRATPPEGDVAKLTSEHAKHTLRRRHLGDSPFVIQDRSPESKMLASTM